MGGFARASPLGKNSNTAAKCHSKAEIFDFLEQNPQRIPIRLW